MISATFFNCFSYRAALLAIVSAAAMALAFGVQSANAACPEFPTPYYESSCAPVSPPPGTVAPPPGTPVKPTLKVKVSGKCKRKSFKVKPAITGGIVTRVTATVNRKRIARATKSPYAFTVKLRKIKKVKKNKRYTLRVATTFTSGQVVITKAKFKTCKS